jgi:hypothetical protein
VQEWEIAGHHEHAVRSGHLEGRMDAANRPEARSDVWMDGQTEVGEALDVGGDEEDAVRDPLQDIHLPYDDGAPVDDQPALVPAAQAPSLASGDDCRGDGRCHHEQIMTEVSVGRLLPASLHQAILDELPQRLEFYEHWLTPEGLRDGTIGLAPITAVLGFLRTEGPAYDRIMSTAGRLAAEWTLAGSAPIGRRAAAWLPRSLRARSAMRAACRIVRSTSVATTTASRVRRGEATLGVRASLFCAVREVRQSPLCAFYLAVAIETLRQFGLPAIGRVDQCQAMGHTLCVVVLALRESADAPDPAMAA